MRPGQIVTFYSYKGGVGRSMALCNCAALLASWGFRVLCVDWDLEAPGLRNYLLNQKSKIGKLALLDLILRPASIKRQWRQAVSNTTISVMASDKRKIEVEFDLILSTVNPESIGDQLRKLNWDDLFLRKNLAQHLEDLRAQWKKHYDFVLLDSRTGISDVGGICTVQLPDILVMLTTASAQGIDGTLEVARRARAARNGLPFDRANVPVVPIPSRIDTRVEYQLQQDWLQRFADSFKDLVAPWLHQSVTARALVEQLRIPYVPYWSYGETLAVTQETSSDPENISAAFDALAALLARRLDRTDLLVNSRADFVQGARELPSSEHAAPMANFFISYTNDSRAYADQLRDALRQRGAQVFSASDIVAGQEFRQALTDAVNSAENILFVIGAQGASKWQFEELSIVLRRLARSADESQANVHAKIIVTPEARGKPLHAAMAALQRLYIEHDNFDELAADLVSPNQLSA